MLGGGEGGQEALKAGGASSAPMIAIQTPADQSLQTRVNQGLGCW